MADDDDWRGGEPPEGRVTRDRSRPGYWQSQWQAGVAYGILGVVIVLAVILVLVLG